jgi:Cu-processing system permease protein
VSDALVIARLALQEAVRRRVLAVVAVLTLLSGVLYVVGCVSLKHHIAGALEANGGIIKPIVPATLLGLASFGALFLGSVLSVFLTAGAVRGDADRGLVQPLVVRPVGRTAYLAGRGLAAVTISGGYVIVISTLATATTRLLFTDLPSGSWRAIPLLVAAVTVVTVITLLMSCLLSTVATGISVLMAYGAGLVAGLLGEIGRAFHATTVTAIADTVSYLLPFEALYRAALAQLSQKGLIGQLLELGPLCGARAGGPGLWIFCVAYVLATLWCTKWLFGRSDL